MPNSIGSKEAALNIDDLVFNATGQEALAVTVQAIRVAAFMTPIHCLGVSALLDFPALKCSFWTSKPLNIGEVI